MTKSIKLLALLLILSTSLLTGLFLTKRRQVSKLLAISQTITLKIKIQGSQAPGAKIYANVSLFDEQKKVKDYPMTLFSREAASETFSADIKVQDLDPSNKYSFLIKPTKGVAKVFCGANKSGENCYQSNFYLIEGGLYELDFETILLGDLPPQDGKINARDLSFIKGNLGKDFGDADVNDDKIVDTQDFSLALFSLGKNASDDTINWLGKAPAVSLTPVPSSSPVPSPTLAITPGGLGRTIDKKVLTIIFDPVLVSQNKQKLTEYKAWKNPYDTTNEAVDWFKNLSQNRINYQVVENIEANEFIKKEDGFIYNENTYLQCTADNSSCHSPDTADYSLILNSYNVCNRVNSGEVDELWLFGGPWFGFYESRLAGPNGFEYNSPPLGGTSCSKLIPIMGFSYEYGVENMVHDFGHRAEATMTKVYGSWEENRLEHSWDKFGLVKTQSPNFNFSGCGSTHYAPNSPDGYIYDSSINVDSFCDNFFNYPNLSPAENVLKTINCNAWSCSEIGYYEYWFGHLPKFTGVGPDDKLNDWWEYILDPNVVK